MLEDVIVFEFPLDKKCLLATLMASILAYKNYTRSVTIDDARGRNCVRISFWKEVLLTTLISSMCTRRITFLPRHEFKII